MKNGMSIEDFMEKFNINYNELSGILELCRIYGKNIDIIEPVVTIKSKLSEENCLQLYKMAEDLIKK